MSQKLNLVVGLRMKTSFMSNFWIYIKKVSTFWSLMRNSNVAIKMLNH